MVKHDEYLKPIIPPKYRVYFKAYNCNLNLLRELEPWCDKIFLDSGAIGKYVHQYKLEEQSNTKFDLDERTWMYGNSKITDKDAVIVEFDCNKLNADNFQILVNLSEILQESGELGVMELEIFKFHINSLETYEKELINVV
tara:strand:- start:112 stop:534 length:423 start_codon:yes stop_codon:yes gene_type:complete